MVYVLKKNDLNHRSDSGKDPKIILLLARVSNSSRTGKKDPNPMLYLAIMETIVYDTA